MFTMCCVHTCPEHCSSDGPRAADGFQRCSPLQLQDSAATFSTVTGTSSMGQQVAGLKMTAARCPPLT